MIDIAFDFRSDTPPGKDPDEYSRTLRFYHKILWSKPLASGSRFELSDGHPRAYLHHSSSLGEFFLTSDGAITTFWKEARLKPVFTQAPGMLATFQRAACTIGGMIVFPGNCVDRKMTINGARGFHPAIKDRFDLTVECIRRFYLSQPSPLQEVLGRYATFFALFGDFGGYVRHFLLEDLVSHDCSSVNFFAPFDEFGTPPVPGSAQEYSEYRDRAMAFIAARNRRIQASLGIG